MSHAEAGNRKRLIGCRSFPAKIRGGGGHAREGGF